MKRIEKTKRLNEARTGQEVTQLDTESGEKEILSPKQVRQREFLRAYTANGFNITQACISSGVGRKTYYHWLDRDPAFCEDLRIAQDELKDYLKSKLLELVEANNLIAIIFANKTLGQMVECTRQDITVREGPKWDQAQIDAAVRGQIDRSKYNKMLGLPDPDPD